MKITKEMKALLAKINAKKAEAQQLVEADKIDEAKAIIAEMKKMQDKFDAMAELADDEQEVIEDQVVTGNAKAIGEKPNYIGAFINVIKAAVLKKPVDSKDMEVLNMMTQADPVDGVSDGGVTVPKDIRTQIKEMRRSMDALENLVNVEPVTTLSGSRVLEINADQVPFDNVEEAAQFPDVATPQFTTVEYKVKKKGGILKITRELLQDTAENIIGYLRRWIAKKSKATRNFLILAELEESFGGEKAVAITNLDSLKNIFNVQLDPAIAISSRILTNQDGFNWLDKLKDEDKKYVLQPNPVDATKKLLFGRYPVEVVANKVMPSVAGKAPVYCGDFKEAITIFDRESLSIEFSTEAGDLWGKDLTGVKVRERLDIKTIDNEAVIKGEVTI